MGVADSKTREKLLFDTQLTLDKAIEILRAGETSSAITEKKPTEYVTLLSKSSEQKQHQAQKTVFKIANFWFIYQGVS